MRFVHMADIHFDTPFKVLAERADLAGVRRLEQREAFKKAIEYVGENNIPYLFICGDLFEQEYVKESTIEYINNLFKKINNTKIFITPGNHDPRVKNSFYNKFNWNENVTIFNEKIKKIELEEADLYGFGFPDFYHVSSELENIKIENKNKLNILITHGALDASTKLDLQYNPIKANKLKEIGFDYAALGHVHKNNYLNNENNFIYSGSLISLGFDELGEHGILDVEINKNKIKNNIKINFIKIDERIFEEKMINISEINSQEELIEKINNINLEKNKNYKIILNGFKKIEIKTEEIKKLISKKEILKIKDESNFEYDEEKLAKKNNLKGICIKKILEKKENKIYSDSDAKKAIEMLINMF